MADTYLRYVECCSLVYVCVCVWVFSYTLKTVSNKDEVHGTEAKLGYDQKEVHAIPTAETQILTSR